MNSDISNIDTSSLDNTLMGINMNPSQLIWTTVITIIISHFGANYLSGITPRGYVFWFTLLNIIVGFGMMGF